MAATDTDSMHDNMTRLRMKMVQQVRRFVILLFSPLSLASLSEVFKHSVTAFSSACRNPRRFGSQLGLVSLKII